MGVSSENTFKLLTSIWLYLLTFISLSAGWNSHVINFYRFVVFTALTCSFFPKINLIYGQKPQRTLRNSAKNAKKNSFAPSAYIFAFFAVSTISSSENKFN